MSPRVRVAHEPDWVAVDLPSDTAGSTTPGFICVHGMEDGSGPCGLTRVDEPEAEWGACDDPANHGCWAYPADATGQPWGAHWSRGQLEAMAVAGVRARVDEYRRNAERMTVRGYTREKAMRALDEEREPAYGLCDTAYDAHGRALRRATLKRPRHQEWGGGQSVMSPGWPS